MARHFSGGFGVRWRRVGTARPGSGGGEQDATRLVEVGEGEEPMEPGGVFFRPR